MWRWQWAWERWLAALCGGALVGAVLVAVHHAEVVAHRVGEPFGTLVLALAVTAIEAALILSMMIAGGEEMAKPPCDATAIGPHLYDGTSGVALFMAEAAARFGDDRLRATALGAIRHALHHAPAGRERRRRPVRRPDRGRIRGGARRPVLEAEEALAGARELLLAWRRDLVPSAAWDLIDGRAGALTGLAGAHPAGRGTLARRGGGADWGRN